MSFDQNFEGVSREQLIAATSAASQKLIDAIDSSSVMDCMEKTDDAGWNCRDHLVHVNAWQWAVIHPLQGKSQAEALGVTDEESRLPLDELNDLIRTRAQRQPLELAVKAAIDVHKALEELLREIDMDELWRPTIEVAPDLPNVTSDQPYIHAFMYYSVDHYDEHRGCVNMILSS